MSLRLLVPEPLRAKAEEFVRTTAADIELVHEEPCDVRVVVSEGRQQSDLQTIQAGGWIACATAWAMAARHDLSVRKLGELLNLFDVKIKECCLGCFK